MWQSLSLVLWSSWPLLSFQVRLNFMTPWLCTRRFSVAFAWQPTTIPYIVSKLKPTELLFMIRIKTSISAFKCGEIHTGHRCLTIFIALCVSANLGENQTDKYPATKVSTSHQRILRNLSPLLFLDHSRRLHKVISTLRWLPINISLWPRQFSCRTYLRQTLLPYSSRIMSVTWTFHVRY